MVTSTSTVREVFDSLSHAQKQTAYYMVGSVLETGSFPQNLPDYLTMTRSQKHVVRYLIEQASKKK